MISSLRITANTQQVFRYFFTLLSVLIMQKLLQLGELRCLFSFLDTAVIAGVVDFGISVSGGSGCVIGGAGWLSLCAWLGLVEPLTVISGLCPRPAWSLGLVTWTNVYISRPDWIAIKSHASAASLTHSFAMPSSLWPPHSLGPSLSPLGSDTLIHTDPLTPTSLCHILRWNTSIRILSRLFLCRIFHFGSLNQASSFQLSHTLGFPYSSSFTWTPSTHLPQLSHFCFLISSLTVTSCARLT